MISDIDEKVNKFELVKHRKTNHVEIDPYKTPSGVQMMIRYTENNLSDYSTNDLKFKSHMNKIINFSKIIMGMLLRTFSTREKDPMLKMFNTYIKSKMECKNRYMS